MEIKENEEYYFNVDRYLLLPGQAVLKEFIKKYNVKTQKIILSHCGEVWKIKWAKPIDKVGDLETFKYFFVTSRINQLSTCFEKYYPIIDVELII